MAETYHENWDEFLPWVLFAYREVPVKGINFASFDLMFGREVCGPLSLIKQFWLTETVDEFLSKSKKTNLVDFVLDLREKVRTAVEAANDNTIVSQAKSKSWFDRKTVEVSFDVGDKVLLLLPVKGKPLQAQYCGPYEVMRKLGRVDYVVSTPDRRKK